VGPGGEEKVVTVTQPAAVGSVLAPASTTLSVPATGGPVAIAVNSNIQWWDYTEYNWLGLTTYFGTGNGTISLKPAKNTTSAARTATIIIKGNGVATQTVTITQAAP
jgi:hypothetical protein